ncbi:ATP-dependent nuclease [Winogradskyella wichelsiae]|uniref:ATP-dependent nuclease n=1 Tax=Winogradskyella wichelsiae TaxID=2697007 RepID=UPI003EF1F53E
MYISKLSIRNYRNFKNVLLKFEKGVNTIIGENGSGKTNLFHALRILIDESMPRNIRFYESDFCRALGSWYGHWIVIQIEFAELDSSEEAQAIAMHKVGSADELDKTTGTYTIYFRPRLDIRRSLFELSEDPTKTTDKLEEILGKISLNDYEVVYTGRGNGNFSNEATYEEFVGNFDEIMFPNPDEEQTDIWNKNVWYYNTK